MISIDEQVERLFKEMPVERDGCCQNPITGAGFVKKRDPIEPQKEAARRALEAREWFAIHGPPDAPPLPICQKEWEYMRYRGSTGFQRMVGFYARSLAGQGHNVDLHASFDDYGCGVTALDLFNEHPAFKNYKEDLLKRFPPRPLAGLDGGLWWSPKQIAKREAAARSKRGKGRGAAVPPRSASR